MDPVVVLREVQAALTVTDVYKDGGSLLEYVTKALDEMLEGVGIGLIDFHLSHPAECSTPEEWRAFARKCHDFISRRGYRYCDIPACNCGSWHEGNADRRLSEIREALGDLVQGETILGAVEKLMESCARGYEGQ